MTSLTISAGAKQGAYLEDDGAFAATLVTFERRGPFDSKQPKFPGEQFHLFEWGFAIEDAPEDACMVWATSGESTGPKSKTFGYISALFGGKQPPVGTTLDIEKQLIGRMALVTVRKDEQGYMKVDAVTPLPKALQKSTAPKAAKPAPVVDDEGSDDAPF